MANNEIKLFFNRAPLSLNKLFRMHWSKRKVEEDTWPHKVHAHWLEIQRPVFLKPVRIEYTIFFDSNRDRDYDNYIGGTKMITDALRRTFITRDDAKWLKGININFENSKEGTLISIREA